MGVPKLVVGQGLPVVFVYVNSHSVKESLCERRGVERMCFQLRP